MLKRRGHLFLQLYLKSNPSITGRINIDIFHKDIELFIKSPHTGKDKPTLLIVGRHSRHQSLKAEVSI